jgi:hypothetical protein
MSVRTEHLGSHNTDFLEIFRTAEEYLSESRARMTDTLREYKHTFLSHLAHFLE